MRAPYDLGMALGPKPDAELVRLARDGDLDAFAEIVRRHERRLRAAVQRILDDPRDVEEAVQDSFVLAWRNLHAYRGRSALFTWLYRIGVNAALGRARRKRATTVELSAVEHRAADPAVAPDPAEHAEAAEIRRRVLEALARLPFEQREAVVLRDVLGLSNLEVADALGIGLAAAKSRIHRGRLGLCALLETRSWSE